MSFLSELHHSSHLLVMSQIQQCLGVSDSCLSASIAKPKEPACVQVEGFWLPVGSEHPEVPQNYVLTESVKKHLKNLARVVSAK